MLFYITLLSVSAGATNVLVHFGKDNIVVCPGDNVTIVWTGYDNLQEVAQPLSCSANHGGEEIVPSKSSGHTETFHDIYAQPGKMRHFICTLHCENAGITVSCPALVPNYTKEMPVAAMSNDTRQCSERGGKATKSRPAVRDGVVASDPQIVPTVDFWRTLFGVSPWNRRVVVPTNRHGNAVCFD